MPPASREGEPLHLKRVELENFKSFGRKLTVPFLEGFTAITGPNGSGKSNIGDAVLFVLGPKSNKAIRAGKLTDLIFNGGKEKKPSDFCKVSLVFDNRDRVIPVDEDDVTLTRLVKLSKASPENYYSYFYVNGKPSSLTEFDNLLAHSRISADGYNIVRQGDVLRIVEMTPLERRRILDDIAGITKFDLDIEKAAKEGAEVEMNLERIRIILDEIDRQLTTLERERDAALKWKAVKEDLDVAKAKLARKRRDGTAAEIASVRAQAAEQDAERERLLGEADRLKLLLAEAEAELRKIDGKISDRGGAEAKELKIKLDALRVEIARATERVNYAKQEIDGLREDRAQYQGDLKRIEKDLAKLQKEHETAASKKDGLDAKLAERTSKLEALRESLAQGTGRAGEITRELAGMKVEFERAAAAILAEKVERDRLQHASERLKGRIVEIGEEKETILFEVKDVDWELKDLEKDAGASTGSVEEARKSLFAKKKREAEVSQQLKDLEPAIRRMQNDYSRLKAEQDASEAVSRGFTRAVDGVLEARDHGRLKGICGTISELGRVDRKFETAMEVAAGGRMQAIVTETDEDAARAIDYLKQNRLGRATFLPLNKMVPGRPAGKPLMAVRDPGAEGFAIDLIRYDDKYKAAFWYVFRDTVIVKSMDAARKLMGGTRLVTLDGDLIDAGGAMTGGDLGERQGAKKPGFGAASKESLEKIALELRGAIGHQEALSAELIELRDEIAKLETVIREGSHASQSKGDRVKALKARRDQLTTKGFELDAARAEREREMSDTLNALQAANAKIAELEARLATLEVERDAKGKLLVAATSKDVGQELARLEAEVADLRSLVRDLASEVETKATNLNLVLERKAEVEAKLAEIESKTAAHEAAGREAQALIASREGELRILIEIETQQSEELRQLQEQRDRAYDRRSDLQGKATKVVERADVCADQAAVLRGRIPLLEATLAELTAEVATYAHVVLPDEVPETLESLRARIRSLEGQLEALGNVNMLALDEYDRQTARKRDLTAEVERLVVERENLEKLVAEIVARKKEGFFKVFHEINDNFQKVFARLSDGGKAELMLENPEEPFEGGLFMRAQPKGKKVTRLEALSGGEKSLTSMAFIFAIQEYDPSPFYYLDEVDQNLDGINSELLARLVKLNSRTAQCIVVSLRKVTLKEADHVYGVTMTDAGLSEVVGEVRISEIVEEPPAAEAGQSTLAAEVPR